jgi:hypothetical protein
MSICSNIKIFGLPYSYTRGQKNSAIVPSRILKGAMHPIKGRVKFGLGVRNVNIVPGPVPSVIRLSKIY